MFNLGPLLSPLKTFFLYCKDYLRGAKIDGRLELHGPSRHPGNSYPRPDAYPAEIIENLYGKRLIYEAHDMIIEWHLTFHHKLILKNNSPSKAAIYVTLPNLSSCFNSHDEIPRQLSLAPLEEIEFKVTYQTIVHNASGEEAVRGLPYVPQEFEGRILHIDYKNEAGKKLRTNFRISNNLDGQTNVYTYPE